MSHKRILGIRFIKSGHTGLRSVLYDVESGAEVGNVTNIIVTEPASSSDMLKVTATFYLLNVEVIDQQ